MVSTWRQRSDALEGAVRRPVGFRPSGFLRISDFELRISVRSLPQHRQRADFLALLISEIVGGNSLHSKSPAGGLGFEAQAVMDGHALSSRAAALAAALPQIERGAGSVETLRTARHGCVHEFRTAWLEETESVIRS